MRKACNKQRKSLIRSRFALNKWFKLSPEFRKDLSQRKSAFLSNDFPSWKNVLKSELSLALGNSLLSYEEELNDTHTSSVDLNHDDFTFVVEQNEENLKGLIEEFGLLFEQIELKTQNVSVTLPEALNGENIIVIPQNVDVKKLEEKLQEKRKEKKNVFNTPPSNKNH